MTWLTVVLAVGAVARTTTFITRDHLFQRARWWLQSRRWVPGKVAYLIGCPWCLSVWLAVPWAVWAVWWPDVRWPALPALVLTASHVTGLLTPPADPTEDDEFAAYLEGDPDAEPPDVD